MAAGRAAQIEAFVEARLKLEQDYNNELDAIRQQVLGARHSITIFEEYKEIAALRKEIEKLVKTRKQINQVYYDTDYLDEPKKKKIRKDILRCRRIIRMNEKRIDRLVSINIEEEKRLRIECDKKYKNMRLELMTPEISSLIEGICGRCEYHAAWCVCTCRDCKQLCLICKC